MTIEEMRNGATTTYKIDTKATVNREISVEVEATFDYVEFLDIDPDDVDENFELLDVKVTEGYNPFVEKLYKVPANDIFPSFVFMFCYNLNPCGEETIYFPKDMEESGYITDFENLEYNHSCLEWLSEQDFIINLAGNCAAEDDDEDF